MIYDNTNLDQEFFIKDIISPLVAQFPSLSCATISSMIDPATKKTIARELQIINDYGEIEYNFNCDGFSITELALHIFEILREYMKGE